MSWLAAATALSGVLGYKGQKDANRANIALQRDFANNSIQWKVEDAKKAGIHPLYALGAQTHQPTFAAGNEKAPIGDAITEAAKMVHKDPLMQAQLEKTKAETDFINQQKKASEEAMVRQNMNSRQDDGLLDIQAGMEPKSKEVVSGIGNKGGWVTTPLGHRFKVSPSASAEAYETEYGEFPALLYGTAKWLNDRNFFNSKKLGSEFRRLMDLAAKDKKHAYQMYNAKKFFFGPYIAQWIDQRARKIHGTKSYSERFRNKLGVK